MEVKAASPERRDDLLKTISFGDHLARSSQVGTECAPGSVGDFSSAEGDITRPTAKLHRGSEGALIYHGPTSIYRLQAEEFGLWSGSGDDGLPKWPPAPGSDYDSHAQVAAHFGMDLNGPIVAEALLLFFRWQYPHFMFIYREAFLREHYADPSTRNSTYWAPGLLLSICALGTLMGDDPDRHETSDRFFAAAESIMLVSGLTQSSITNLQTFLCLAFFEIGRGNFSKGWGYSGTLYSLAAPDAEVIADSLCRDCLSYGPGPRRSARPSELDPLQRGACYGRGPRDSQKNLLGVLCFRQNYQSHPRTPRVLPTR